MDNMIKGITENKEIRFTAIESTNVTLDAVKIHELEPMNTVIFGRILSAALMMASELTRKEDVLTIKIESDGPVDQVVATSDRSGSVKGLLRRKNQDPDSRSPEIMTMKDTLGKGRLSIIKDHGSGNPYIGQVELKFGTIARDLTYYYAKSEQIPSSVSLGVLLDDNGKVRKSGGFIIHIMPEAEESTIAQVEENLHKFPNLTDVLDMGFSIEEIVRDQILKGLKVKINTEQRVKYKCDCSKERFKKGISYLSDQELEEIVNDDKTINVECHFCNKEYKIEIDEIKGILDNRK